MRLQVFMSLLGFVEGDFSLYYFDVDLLVQTDCEG